MELARLEPGRARSRLARSPRAPPTPFLTLPHAQPSASAAAGATNRSCQPIGLLPLRTRSASRDAHIGRRLHSSQGEHLVAAAESPTWRGERGSAQPIAAIGRAERRSGPRDWRVAGSRLRSGLAPPSCPRRYLSADFRIVRRMRRCHARVPSMLLARSSDGTGHGDR
jgi:hypothetical protein